MIGICTDSNSQMPAGLAERYGVEIVPLTVGIDGREYLEGYDLDIDDFYGLYADGHRPRVCFVEPSPGQFAVAYDDLVARGCTQILSVHTAASASCTLRAARLAAHSAPVPVRLVDSGTARFGVSATVWAAGEAIAAGASLDEAAAVAESLAPSIGNVFIAWGLGLNRPQAGECSPARRSVYSLEGESLRAVAHVGNVADAVNAMADFTLRHGAHVEGETGRRLCVAVGHAHRNTSPIAEALAHAVGESAQVLEVVQFRFGPSVAIESGPGTVGCVMFPA